MDEKTEFTNVVSYYSVLLAKYAETLKKVRYSYSITLLSWLTVISINYNAKHITYVYLSTLWIGWITSYPL